MRTLVILALVASLADPMFAGGRRCAAAVSPHPLSNIRADLAIAFVGVSGSGSEAWLDAGTMSKRTRRTFGVRIESPAGTNGTATLRASLENGDARCTVRVDGQVIGTTPKVIDAGARIGVATTHTIEIEVPANVPEGAFAAVLRWDATSN